MASLIFRPCSIKLNYGTYQSPLFLNQIAQYATEIDKALLVNEVPEVCKEFVEIKEERRNLEVEQKDNISTTTEIPDDNVKIRCVRITRPSKNVMLAGNSWQVEFDNDEKWENSLTGCTATGDPLSNMKVQFPSMIYAIKFCEKNDLKFYVETPAKSINRERNFGISSTWNRLRYP